MLTVAATLIACVALAGSARAAAPVFNSSFTCDVITPCGAITSGFSPRRMAVNDVTGDVYVIDTGHDAIIRFNSAGVYQSTIPGSSTTATTFAFGGGEDDIAIDNSGGANQGHVYVISEGSSLAGGNVGVFAFRADGSFFWQASPGGGAADICGVGVNQSGVPYAVDFTLGVRPLSPADGSVAGPALYNTGQCEIAFDSGGASYIRSYDTGEVDKHSAAGALVGTTDSTTNNLDEAVNLSNDDVYLSRAGDVAVYDSTGAAVSGTPFGSTELTGGSGYGVAVNGPGRKVYVSDSGQSKIDLFDIPAVRHTLTVTAGGTGNGRVDADSGLIASCTRSGGVCSDSYDEGAVVRLTATPTNSTITWSGGGCSGSSANCNVTMSADQSVTVTFNQNRPAVAGEGSSGITPTAATLAGTANPNGAATTCTIQWGPTNAYGTTTPVSSNPGSGTSAVAVSIPALSGLTPSTQYHWRIVCTNPGGTTNGADQVFRTLAPPAPAATTGAASNVSQTAASLAGTVNPNGFSTSCRFEYGTTTAYGSSVDCASAPGSGSSAVGVSAALSGLSPGTTYHFRVVATNSGGTTNGTDVTFATGERTCPEDASLCPPGRLAVTSSSATVARGKAPLKVTCGGSTGSTCRGTLALTARVKRGRRTSTISVGRAAYNLAAGQSATLSVKLSGAAKSALAKAPHKLVALASGKKVTLKQPVKRKHKRKHKK